MILAPSLITEHTRLILPEQHAFTIQRQPKTARGWKWQVKLGNSLRIWNNVNR